MSISSNPPAHGKPAQTNVWPRFSAWLQAAIADASQQCSASGVELVSEHELLGALLRLPPERSNARTILARTGVDASALSGADTAVWPPPAPPSSQSASKIALSESAKAALTRSVACANSFGHNRIGTEHVLAALADGGDTAVAQRLAAAGATSAALKEQLGAWMISGQYKPEPAAASSGTPAMSTAVPLGSTVIYQARRMAQIAYVIIILTVAFGPMLVGRSPIGIVLEIINSVLYLQWIFFVIPYVISTYSLNYLINTRWRRGLSNEPPSRAANGLAGPFGMNVVVGILLLAAALPLTLVALRGSPLAATMGDGTVVAGVTLIFTLVCWVLVITHWLILFNVRGPSLSGAR